MIKLRNYQKKSIDRIIDELYTKNLKSTLCCLPTGSGKTIIQAFLLKKILEKFPYYKILYICHKIILLDNFQKALLQINFPQEDIGRWDSIEKTTDCQVTIMSLLSSSREFRPTKNHFNLVIIDEAHHVHMSLNTYQKLLSDKINSDKHKLTYDKIVGFTATYIPIDKKIINKSFYFQSICYSVSYIDLLKQKFLSKINYNIIYTNFDFKQKRNKSKSLKKDISAYISDENFNSNYQIQKKLEKSEFTAEELESLNNITRNKFVLQEYFSNVKKYKRVVIFCPSVSTIKSMYSILENRMVEKKEKNNDVVFVKFGKFIKEKNRSYFYSNLKAKNLCKNGLQKDIVIKQIKKEHMTYVKMRRDVAENFNYKYQEYYFNFITAETHEKHRQSIIDDFQNEENAILLNYEVMIEGVDIPLLNTIFIARPTKSKRVYLQMIGRGTRIVPEKKETVNIVDFIDNDNNFFIHLCEKWRISEYDFKPTEEYERVQRKLKEEKEEIEQEEEEIVSLKETLKKNTDIDIDKKQMRRIINKIENIKYLIIIKNNKGSYLYQFANEDIMNYLRKLGKDIRDNPTYYNNYSWDTLISKKYYSSIHVKKNNKKEYMLSQEKFYYICKNYSKLVLLKDLNNNNDLLKRINLSG